VRCRWSCGLADLMDSMHHHLVTRRLMREAMQYWRGDAERVRLTAECARPVAEVLFSLASIAMFHKDPSLRDAGPSVVSGLTFVLPDRCLPFAVKSVHESLASVEAVHRLEDAIGLLGGAPAAPAVYACMACMKPTARACMQRWCGRCCCTGCRRATMRAKRRQRLERRHSSAHACT
jgi:hypothetical protein